MESVDARKERLKALRELKEKHDAGQISENSENEQHHDFLPKPVFRSYRPNDENLKLAQMPKIAPINVADIIKEEIKAAQEKNVIEDVKLAHIAPRKIDWDLKRDIADHLEKLRKREMKAFAEIAQEDLQNGRNSVPLYNPKEQLDVNDDDDD